MARAKAVPKPTGRPSKYTDEIAAEIVERLSDGEPLAQICRADHMPDPATVWRWQQEKPELSQAIARARRFGFDVIAQRARQTLRGKTIEDGGESTGDIQRDKAIADFDLKLLSKWDPKRYGDKLALTGGGEDDAPIRTVRRIERVIVDPQDRDA